MGEKDIVERHLEEYNDVFADMVNGLLFGGERVIAPEDLQDAPGRSLYKAGGKIREQERDIAKLWKKEGVVFSLFGLENQTTVDSRMPLRAIGYDGAAYRAQLEAPHHYPVVTLVLYFGEALWTAPKTLLEVLDVPEGLRPFVNDYRLNLFDIPRMSDEEIAGFRGDFRIVADYFAQVWRRKNYEPSRQVIEHVDAVLKLMQVLTNDERFERAQNDIGKEGKKMATMMSVLDTVEERGIHKGLTQGRVEGSFARARGVAAAMYREGDPVEKIARITDEDVEVIRSWIREFEAGRDA